MNKQLHGKRNCLSSFKSPTRPPCSWLTEPGQILLTFPPTYLESIKCHANINLKNKRQYNLSQRVLDACKSDPLLRFKNSLSSSTATLWLGWGGGVMSKRTSIIFSLKNVKLKLHYHSPLTLILTSECLLLNLSIISGLLFTNTRKNNS